MIEKLRGDVAKFIALPKGVRDDLDDSLKRAKEAGETGDKDRLLKKLETAEKELINSGVDSDSVRALIATVSAAQQRASALSY